MNIIFLIALVLAAVSGQFALVKQFQMLQQNSYFPSRYLKWVKENYLTNILFELSLFLFYLALPDDSHPLFLVIFFLILLEIRIMGANKTQKKSIKKLVFTARVKRFFIAAIIISLLIILLYAFLPSLEIISKIGMLLFLCAPLFCLICRIVTAPIDKAITNWYINDAKKLLKNHKGLITIGVTGSYGKTTTKFILSRILSEKFNVLATPQSFNTPLGVVRTVRESLKPQTQVFVCEMGAKNVGDIKEICDIAHPDYGIITSVGPQHLETFKSVDNVFKTKFELADEVLKNGGNIFVNGDSAELIKRADNPKYITYGTGEFNATAKNISYGKNGSSFTAVVGDTKIELTSKLLGMHSILNILGATAIALSLGLTADEIRYAVASLKPTEHRLELKPFTNGSTLIDDAYNANPEGCLEAVNVLASFDNMKKVIVTPGLIELGEKEYECNFNLGVSAAKKCDIIILVGLTRSKPIKDGVLSAGFNKENLYTVASFKDAMAVYNKIADKNTVVLFENDLPDNYLK